MDTTVSKDGTALAYDRVGSGPALVFVPGVFNLRDTCAPIAAQLTDAFTSYTYDRRARGDSSNTRPYTVEREVEDLQAILDVAGGRASVFGYSSGAILALRAAADGLPIERLFLYEPPFRFDEPASPTDFPERLQAMVDEGRTADVVSTFQLEGVGLSAEVVAGIRQAPFFPQLQAVVPLDVANRTAFGEGCATGMGGATAERAVVDVTKRSTSLPSSRLPSSTACPTTTCRLARAPTGELWLTSSPTSKTTSWTCPVSARAGGAATS